VNDPIAIVGTSQSPLAHDLTLFDADFFDIPAREAQLVAPQHRLLLECVWQALESAAESSTIKTGIFASIDADDRYLRDHLLSYPILLQSFSQSEIETLTSSDLAPSWVCRKLNLKGPCVRIESDSPRHAACLSLQNNDCDLALAGRVAVLDQPHAEFVVLKRLNDAIRDRNSIKSIINGDSLEAAPALSASGASRLWQAICFSAKSEPALSEMAAHLKEYLNNHPTIDLSDVAYSLHTGRRSFGYRRSLVCSTASEAVEHLAQINPSSSRFSTSTRKPVVFMFPGAGAHYIQMGRRLYESEVFFRNAFDRCREILLSQESIDLRSVLYPEDTKAKFDQPVPVLAALFAVEYSVAQLWIKWGVVPESMIGHSLGEYVAACLAGVFSLEDALEVVAFRGHLFERLPSGAMLSVSLGEQELGPYLSDTVSLAAINAPAHCVLSGSLESLEQVQESLSNREVETRLLPVGKAGHSAFVDPIREEFADFVGTLKLGIPRIPYMSNYTGTWIKETEAVDPSYWAAHLRYTVRFSQALDELLLNPDRIFLEAGPGNTLSTLARRHAQTSDRVIVSSMRHVKDPHSDSEIIVQAMAHLWTAGVQIDFDAFYSGQQRNRISLPTYPFQRRRYWVDEAPITKTGSSSEPRQHIEPRNEIEAAIASIWTEVLGVHKVSVDQSFGDLGGSEALLQRMQLRLIEEFGVSGDERCGLNCSISDLADMVAELALGDISEEELAKTLGATDLATN
jgi:acyl transferase domain-containing protein